MSLSELANLKNKLTTEGEIVRARDSVIFKENTTDSAIAEEDETCLFRIQKKSGKHFIIPQNNNQHNDRLWMVIRSMKEGYVIKKFDIIKLGRMKFRVKEFRTETDYFEDLDNDKTPHPGFDEFYEVAQADEPEATCRFCWTGDQTEENPLICACKCSGSIRFIHFQCVKMWLQTKVTKKEGPGHCTLNWKNFECELCKKAYPYTFVLKGERRFLVDLHRPTDNDTPYMIMESLSSDKNSSRTVHIVTMNTPTTSFSLGRGHDSELRINDISVSRKHASLEYKNGDFVLTDLKSKFGTLVLISHNVELSEQSNNTFQIGRTVVVAKAKCEAPWKRGGERSGNMVPNYKGEEYQRVQELLKDSKSLTRKANDDKSLAKSNFQRAQTNAPEGLPELARLRSDNTAPQEKDVVEIDGKRYIILKQLDDEQNQE